jgi:hypothetical protein
MTKSAISHQLGILRRANLVKFRREGKNVFYALSDDHVRRMIEAASSISTNSIAEDAAPGKTIPELSPIKSFKIQICFYLSIIQTDVQ